MYNEISIDLFDQKYDLEIWKSDWLKMILIGE